jgi:hypothetical protein
MRRHRYVQTGLALAALLGVTAALARNVGHAPLTAPEPREDYEADEYLDRAVAALAPERVAWLDCGIRQKVDLPGLHYESEGQYLLAPSHRFRLEVHTWGPGVGTLLWVSDGTEAWQAARAGDGPWRSVSRLRLREVFASMSGSAASPQLRAEFLNGPTMGGVGPLLRTLRTRLMWIRHQASQETVELMAVWPSSTLQELVPPDRPWPPGLPRTCRLALDARSLWPRAVEWWGPGSAGDVLLARTEYENRGLNRPLAPQLCARSFAFDPGDAPVTDRTGQVTADLAARALQIASESTAR